MAGMFTSYNIRILGQGGQVVSVLSLICANDDDVSLAAQLIRRPCGLEIWDGDRLVAAFPPATAKAA